MIVKWLAGLSPVEITIVSFMVMLLGVMIVGLICTIIFKEMDRIETLEEWLHKQEQERRRNKQWR